MGDYAYLVLARNAAFMVISAGKTDKNRELFIQIICDCYSWVGKVGMQNLLDALATHILQKITSMTLTVVIFLWQQMRLLNTHNT